MVLLLCSLVTSHILMCDCARSARASLPTLYDRHSSPSAKIPWLNFPFLVSALRYPIKLQTLHIGMSQGKMDQRLHFHLDFERILERSANQLPLIVQVLARNGILILCIPRCASAVSCDVT
jgi:hypothetical protein